MKYTVHVLIPLQGKGMYRVPLPYMTKALHTKTSQMPIRELAPHEEGFTACHAVIDVGPTSLAYPDASEASVIQFISDWEK